MFCFTLLNNVVTMEIDMFDFCSKFLFLATNSENLHEKKCNIIIFLCVREFQVSEGVLKWKLWFLFEYLVQLKILV